MKYKEIDRLHVSGKTFFFNLGETNKGKPILGINTMFGKGGRERIVLLEEQILPFLKQLVTVAESVLGVEIQGNGGEPGGCPGCGEQLVREKTGKFLATRSTIEEDVYLECQLCAFKWRVEVEEVDDTIRYNWEGLK